MIRKYIQAGMEHAQYEILPDDGAFYGRSGSVLVSIQTHQLWKSAGKIWKRFWRNGLYFVYTRIWRHPQSITSKSGFEFIEKG
jgi:hypothetical protein